MSANANVIEPVRGTSTLQRPRYSPGLLLRDDDLRVGVDYTRDLSRLLFSSLFGCGVVCGLVVTRKVSCQKLYVTIDSGVALNCEGDPIYVPKPVTVTIDPSCSKVPDTLWVKLCLTEKCCAPRSAVCSCDDDEVANVCTREQFGYEISIVSENPKACECEYHPLPKVPAPGATPDRFGSTAGPVPLQNCWCANPCSACHKDHYAGKCSCDCCGADCIVLARLDRTDQTDSNELGTWEVNHSVRRFIRPVLMRDPQVWLEQHPGSDPCAPPTEIKKNGPKVVFKQANTAKAAAKRASQAKVARALTVPKPQKKG